MSCRDKTSQQNHVHITSVYVLSASSYANTAYLFHLVVNTTLQWGTLNRTY